jgi:hypothetical protein
MIEYFLNKNLSIVASREESNETWLWDSTSSSEKGSSPSSQCNLSRWLRLYRQAGDFNGRACRRIDIEKFSIDAD